MLFLTALFTTLAAAYLSDKIAPYSPEIAVGCIAVALFSSLVTLIAAPWQFQLLVLIGSLMLYRLTKPNLSP